MYSEDDLSSAVNAGVLTEAQAAAFREHVAAARRSPSIDEEHFRLVTGFNDIFVVIACVLLLVSVKWLGDAFSEALGAGVMTGTAWALAEFFTRKRRMALPSIVLLLAWTFGVFLLATSFSDRTTGSLSLAAAAACAASWLHWRRFRVPITVAAGAGALVGCVVAMIFAGAENARVWLSPALFLSGLAVFALAMRWDAADPRRETRKSDIAFWLHLLAAPLLVHPIFSGLDVLGGETSLAAAGAVVVLYLAIAVLSLAIDRRALMVSALGYVLYAFSSLLEDYGVVSLGFAITAFAIGSGLLLLSAFWHGSRGFIVRRLPVSLRLHIPPLR